MLAFCFREDKVNRCAFGRRIVSLTVRLKDFAILGSDVQKVPKPESEQARGEGRDTSKRPTG